MDPKVPPLFFYLTPSREPPAIQALGTDRRLAIFPSARSSLNLIVDLFVTRYGSYMYTSAHLSLI